MQSKKPLESNLMIGTPFYGKVILHISRIFSANISISISISANISSITFSVQEVLLDNFIMPASLFNENDYVCSEEEMEQKPKEEVSDSE